MLSTNITGDSSIVQHRSETPSMGRPEDSAESKRNDRASVRRERHALERHEAMWEMWLGELLTERECCWIKETFRYIAGKEILSKGSNVGDAYVGYARWMRIALLSGGIT